jgi:hypothetical protein
MTLDRSQLSASQPATQPVSGDARRAMLQSTS